MGKTTSQAGIDLIKSFEGCVLKAYRCPANVLTIGYGHTGNDVCEGLVWTQAQADNALKNDLKKYENYVNSLAQEFDYNFSQCQFDALVSFTYNCGKGNLYKLTQNGARTTNEIYNALPLYNKAKGKVLTGLARRRTAEQKLFASGKTTTQGNSVNVDMSCDVVAINNIVFRFRLNYRIREIPSTSGKIIGSTNDHELCAIKGISKDKQWLLTEYGWINAGALYDKIK